MRDDSNEKPCTSFLAREVQPAAKPAKARVEEEKGARPFDPVVCELQPAIKPAKARVKKEKGARPFGPVSTAVTEGWRTRPWPFTPHAELQPATKPAKARVRKEKGARPFGPVSIAATEEWKTRPWPFTPRAEQAISFGGPVAKETFGVRANDEETVEKALMALSSVAVTSEDSANSNVVPLMAPAESLPGEVREPLLGRASTPLSGRASTPSAVRAYDEESVGKTLLASSSVTVTSEDSAKSNLATLMTPAESFPGQVREPSSGGASTPLSGGASTPLSGGASTPSGGRASPETERPSLALVPATARTRATIRNNRVHRSNVVTRRAAAELTGAVTRYEGVRPNKNNNDDDDNINNNNHAALAERFQSSTLHKLRQLGIYTITDTPDDNDINNNNHTALAERFQPSTLHKLRHLGFYAKKVTPDDNNIYNNNHAALAERFQSSTLHKLRQLGLYTNTDTLDDNNINNNTLAEHFQPSTLHKLRQLGRWTNTDTPDTAHQLDVEAVPAEVAYTRTNTQPSCSGGGKTDRVLQGGLVRFAPSYILTLANAPIIFKVGLQGVTPQPTMGAELVAAALIMKEWTVLFSNMMSELGLGESFGSVPLHTDNTSALQRRRQPYLHSSPKAYRAEVLFFRARTGGGQGQHPLRQERGSAGGFGHQSP